jgi:hypothetical protein
MNDTNMSDGEFCFCLRNDRDYVERAAIAISSYHYSGDNRAYNLRYALMYILGLHGVSSLYPDSIFYDHYSPVGQYSDMDWALVRMLYDERVKAGMSKDEVLAALEAGWQHFGCGEEARRPGIRAREAVHFRLTSKWYI